MESLEDEALLTRIVADEYPAFTALYDKYVKNLTSYGLRFTDNRDDVRDCLHDVFVTIWLKRHKLAIHTSIKGYLFKSVRTSIFQKTKRARKLVFIDDGRTEEYNFQLSISPEESFLENESNLELYRNVQDLLQKLTAKQKEIVYLRFYEGLSFDEIAVQLNLTVKACYKLMNRAMSELRRSPQFPIVLLALLHCLE